MSDSNFIDNMNENGVLPLIVKYHDHGNGVFKLKKIEQGDWIDVYSAIDIRIERFGSAVIPLGFSLQLPEGHEAHLSPRSSTFSKWGIIQTNSVGVIDESYCGDDDEWKMPVFAVRDTEIRCGDKIGQFRIVKKMPEVGFLEVETLSGKSRGGFGSTGSR